MLSPLEALKVEEVSGCLLLVLFPGGCGVSSLHASCFTLSPRKTVYLSVLAVTRRRPNTTQFLVCKPRCSFPPIHREVWEFRAQPGAGGAQGFWGPGDRTTGVDRPSTLSAGMWIWLLPLEGNWGQRHKPNLSQKKADVHHSVTQRVRSFGSANFVFNYSKQGCPFRFFFSPLDNGNLLNDH